MFDALEKRFKKDQKDSRTQEKSTDKPETEEGGGGEGGEEGGNGEEEGGGEEGEVEGGGDDKEKKSDGASSSQTTDDSSKEQIAKPRVSISVSLRIHYTQSHTHISFSHTIGAWNDYMYMFRDNNISPPSVSVIRGED